MAALLITITARGESFPVFAVLFTQITNDIALLQENFDNSPEQKQTLATLVRARSAVVNPELRDEQILTTSVNLLGDDINYSAVLDTAAANARATVLARYDLLATRVSDLPPSSRTTTARTQLNDLDGDRNALANAEHADGISNLLAPFGRRLETLAGLIERAQVMSRPRLGNNAVRAMVNNHRFNSGANGRNSPNIFEVNAPSPLYYAVNCRVVDREEVINFTLPIVTDQVRYEIAQGLATLTYNPEVFGTNSAAVAATSGTFFVQITEKEIYGMFSCEGPGFEIKDGRFRMDIPRALREEQFSLPIAKAAEDTVGRRRQRSE